MIFFFELAWGFGIGKWRGVLVNLQWSPFSRKSRTTNSEQNKNRAKFGTNLTTHAPLIKGWRFTPLVKGMDCPKPLVL